MCLHSLVRGSFFASNPKLYPRCFCFAIKHNTMEIKRKKEATKILNWYKNEHDIQPPYNVMCDASFLQYVTERGWNTIDTVRRGLGITKADALWVCTCKPVRDRLFYDKKSDALTKARELFSVAAYRTTYEEHKHTEWEGITMVLQGMHVFN